MAPEIALAFDNSSFDGVACPQPVTLTDCFDSLRSEALRLRIRPNERFAKEGHEASHVFRIVTGCVRLCRHLEDGRRPIAEFLFAGDLFGLGTADQFGLSAEAVSPVFVMAYPRQSFERITEGQSHIRAEILEHLTVALARSQRHVFALTSQNAQDRVASFLLYLRDRGQSVDGSRITLAMNRQDIADHLGLSVETVCRAMTHLRKAGHIDIINSQIIVIKNTAALRSGVECIALSH